MAFSDGTPVSSPFVSQFPNPLDKRATVINLNEANSFKSVWYEGLLIYDLETKLNYIVTSVNGSLELTVYNPLICSTDLPKESADIASPGTNNRKYSAADHVHPHDSSRASVQYVQTVTKSLETSIKETINTGLQYTNSTPLYTTIGGFELNETFEKVPLTELWTRLLYPYKQPTIKFSATPTNRVIELGNLVDVVLTANITKMSNDITKIEFLQGSSVILTDTNHSTGGIVTHTVNDLGLTSSFRVRVNDGKNNIQSSQITYNFIYPAYVGLIDTDTPSEDVIKSLTKLIQLPANYTYTSPQFTKKRICMACPPGWILSSIKDGNGFENFSSFTQLKVSITGLDGTAKEYTVYFNGISSQNAGFIMTFIR